MLAGRRRPAPEAAPAPIPARRVAGPDRCQDGQAVRIAPARHGAGSPGPLAFRSPSGRDRSRFTTKHRIFRLPLGMVLGGDWEKVKMRFSIKITIPVWRWKVTLEVTFSTDPRAGGWGRETGPTYSPR